MPARLNYWRYAFPAAGQPIQRWRKLEAVDVQARNAEAAAICGLRQLRRGALRRYAAAHDTLRLAVSAPGSPLHANGLPMVVTVFTMKLTLDSGCPASPQPVVEPA